MEHPITPPPELIQQWKRTAPHRANEHEHYHYITLCAAQWGADQELEACCEWLRGEYDWGLAAALRLDAERRPEPPSETEQALAALNEIEDKMLGPTSQEKLIRRALERLKELEQLND